MKLQMRMIESRDEEQGEDDVKLNKFTTDYWGHLKSLPTGCPTTLVIFCDNEIESLSEYEEAFKSRASSLQHLQIGHCGNLRSLSGGLEHLTALESIEINGCTELINLPESIQNLTSLQSLKIVGDRNKRLKDKCRKHSGEYWPIIQHIPTIKLGHHD